MYVHTLEQTLVNFLIFINLNFVLKSFYQVFLSSIRTPVKNAFYLCTLTNKAHGLDRNSKRPLLLKMANYDKHFEMLTPKYLTREHSREYSPSRHEKIHDKAKVWSKLE